MWTARWTPAARLAVAGTVFAAAVWAWDQVAPGDLRVAALAFTAPVLAAGWLGVRLRLALAQSAEALARARVEAADVLGSLSSGVVTVDADGRLLYANAAAHALLGPALAAGAPSRPGPGSVLAGVAAVAPALADALAGAAREGRRTSRAEAPLDLGAGAPAAVLGVTTTVGAGLGGTRTATAIFSDITASRALAAAQGRAERLEAVAELAASLAHEIRNPLAGIRSAVEQLARLAAAAERTALGTDDAADARALAGLTVKESDRLSRLLGEFLDFTRARVTRREPVDVATAARDAARLAAAHPDAVGVAVEVCVETPAETLLVDGDAELLHRALFNLVLNAAQATVAGAGGEGVTLDSRVCGNDDGPARRPRDDIPDRHPREHGDPRSAPPSPLGTVRISVRAAADGARAGLAGAAVLVDVRDDGPGVAPELAGRLFEPFVTGRAGGSGLGLAVVQRAVAAHGGVVLVEPGGGGRGARFTCVLPRAAEGLAAGTPDA